MPPEPTASSPKSGSDNYFNSNTQQPIPGNDNRFNVEIPGVSLPKGGGAIKGIDEKFEVNAINGSANISIPLPSASARGFGASLGISYNSGSGNSIFGMGWSLSLPSIRRKTEKELPQYFDVIDSDTYLFSGGEDLVPAFVETAGAWTPEEKDSPDNQFSIKRYRPRTEGSFARIERWTKKTDGGIHWRVISRDNITSLYGDTSLSVIADPADTKRIFEWLLHFSYDDKGNCVLYEYKLEDGAGIDATLIHNRNRTSGDAPFANTYLKTVRSGNINPYKNGEPIPPANQFLFETVFDYGDHEKANAPFSEINPWSFRPDAFSDYRSGFEIRTCRLCERVLLYHHFDELPGGSALVSSLELKYDNNGQVGNFTFLKEVTSTGYIKHPDNSYTQKSTPPLAFLYQKHEWNKEVKSIPDTSLLNGPIGIYEPTYQWVDLYSEGLNGILTEQANGLYYMENWGNGNFTAAKLVSPKPSFTGIGADLHIQELESNGTKYLTGLSGDVKGYFRMDDDNEWHPFQPFEQIPNIDFKSKNTRLIDLNGDGKAEVLITEDNVFTWYPSKGEKGFDSSRKVWQNFDDEKGARFIFNDAEQSIFLSDMNGDGLTDIVRIKNGSICYWPNLGYGKFGMKVNMDNAPIFDHPDSFNAAYIKLADIDGSGTTDVIYVGKQKFSIWLNQNGNGFLQQPEEIDPFLEISGSTQVSVIDFLGNGTSCIVWNSSLPKDGGQSLRYIDLMKSKKPHLMIGYKNNMGKEVEFEFVASTWFYLQDKLMGTPWVTKLPFPVHCLSKVVYHDRIMKTRFASEYSYHHGYYDHAEREFRGFGRAEQKDAEDITHFVKESGGALNNTIQQDLHQPPVLTKTWFHTGAFLDREKILNQFAQEYSQNNIHPENLLPEPLLPEDLSIDEWRQALRACKGMMLRKEVYALDGSPLSDKPYTVEQQNCTVRRVQPKLGNKYASYLTVNSESISYHYERALNDPRIAHSFVIEVDDFANVKKSITVVYNRKIPAFPEQNIVYTSLTENNFTNTVDETTSYRTPVIFESKLYEITGLPMPLAEYYTFKEMKTLLATATQIDYDVIADGSLQKRVVNWSRLRFRENDGVTVLPFGFLRSKALLHQTYKAAFNQNQLINIFNPKVPFANLDAILLDPQKGGYIFADNYYWVPSATPKYEPTHFFLANAYTDPFGNTSQIFHDTKYHLFVERSVDALNNEMQVNKFNYRVMKPSLMQDLNDNLTAVRFDELGFVYKSFVIGKKGIDEGDEFDDSQEEFSANDFPSSETDYHVFEWFNQSTSAGFDLTNYKPKPNFVKTKVRDTHYHADPLHQTNFLESYTYYSGGGQEILKKTQAEPGKANQVDANGIVSIIPDTSPNLRWVGNGRKILNNKGKSIKEYEPYFSTSPAFDDEKEMVELGKTSITHYDPLGRTIRTDLPNKTFSKVEFTPWLQMTYDNNDTVRDSGWYLDRGSPDPLLSAPLGNEERAAWLAAKHNDTPNTAHLDTLGRTFFSEADNVIEKLTTYVKLDIEGKEIEILDALNRKVIQHDYDLLSRGIKQISMDSGTRWMLQDVVNNPLLNWDQKDHEFSFEYDKLRRPLMSSVKFGNAVPMVFSRIEYGESLPLAASKANNLRGITYKNFDQSGISTILKNDFKGNPETGSKQFLASYKTMVDWSVINAVATEPEVFTNSSIYDAMNRPLKIITPHSPGRSTNEIYPRYNQAGLLDKIEASIKGAANLTTYISNINYNAKGQREEIFYGNGTKTKYYYEEETFRLINMVTTRTSGASILQDLKYTYDPVGNIIRIKDDAQANIFFDGEQVEALSTYEYDAVYRLIIASGRKHAGQTDVQPKAGLSNNNSFRNHPFLHNVNINANDANAFRNYKEIYSYDKAGNMNQQKHVAKNSSWTRTFEYDNNTNLTNRLTKTLLGNGDEYNYTYDAHGNMLGLETLISETWDFQDHLREVDLGGGGKAWYVYDGSGERVRKIIERQNGKREERIYLGIMEIYREHTAGTILLERESLHIMDDRRRIAMVDTPVIQPQSNNESQLTRYQYDNHHGSATLELDETAKVISYEEYFAFGTTSYSTIDATREVAAKRYRYTGKERDEESGLNYHGARYYAMWLCRWTAADPIGIKDGLNVYTYVRNNPLILNDPSGTQCKSAIATCPENEEPTASHSIEAEEQTSSVVGHEVDEMNYKNKLAIQAIREKKVITPQVDLGAQVKRAAEKVNTPEYKAAFLLNSYELPPDRTFLNRGGGGLIGGGVAAGGGLILILSGPPGWVVGVGGALLFAGGVAVSSSSAVQLGSSYAGATTFENDQRMNQATGLTLSLSSPLGLIGGVGGLVYTGTEQGLETGAFWGGMTEAGVTLVYSGGRMVLREVQFGIPSNPAWRKVQPDIRNLYGFEDAASRARPNPAFARNTERIELSHWISQSSYKNTTWGAWVFNRPWNVTPMWGLEHALIDPSRMAFIKQPWQSSYAALQYTGFERSMRLAPPWLIQSGVAASRGVSLGFQYKLSTD